MLFSVKNLYGYRVGASDGLAGGIVDFYFNDLDWRVGHVVISQHPMRRHKSVLLTPEAVKLVDDREEVLHIRLSCEECAGLPGATTVVPVCRQYLRAPSSAANANFDPHLRCATAVAGNEINDGESHLGIVHDFLIDPKTWAIVFLVGRRFGDQEREFLIASSSVTQISFATRRVTIRKESHWDLVFAARNGYDRMLEPEAA